MHHAAHENCSSSSVRLRSQSRSKPDRESNLIIREHPVIRGNSVPMRRRPIRAPAFAELRAEGWKDRRCATARIYFPIEQNLWRLEGLWITARSRRAKRNLKDYWWRVMVITRRRPGWRSIYEPRGVESDGMRPRQRSDGRCRS